ncbi:MAG: DNA gyrase subunit B [Planctomyces sp.]|nr:DNA gyrase subunit B [Planctomyces sp.]
MAGTDSGSDGSHGTSGVYGAEQIKALEGIDGIRLRPDMYIGGTDQHGLHHLVYELVSNSIDEAVNGYATYVLVNLHADGSCTVQDDGRGIPVGPMPDMDNRSALEVVFTELHAGGKFDRRGGYQVGTGGLHGLGVKAVNACSEWVEVEVRREGFVWTMEFAKGRMSAALSKLGATDYDGTKITFRPDPEIFKTATFSYETIHRVLQDAAFLNARLRIRIADDSSGRSDEFYYENGLEAFVKHLNRTENALFPQVIQLEGMQPAEGEGEVGVNVALQYNDGFTETIRCYANGIYNSEGGAHLSGFRSALTRVLNSYARKAGIIKEKDVNVQGEDFREGLAAIITIRHPDPKFEAQTKIRCLNPEVESAVSVVVGEQLTKFLEENPGIAKSICSKGLRAAEAREAARRARDLARDKNKVSGGGLPEKLRDCRNHSLDVSELYLVEGDSAGGSADTGRDSATQAVLPLRGKILNVEKAQLIKVLANQEVAALFKAIGISPVAEDQDVSKRRYGKVILMTDADVDGSHIRTLLLTFMFRHMRELVKQGCVYIARPPLYRVLQKNRRNQKPRYVQTHEEMMAELLSLGLHGSEFVIRPRPDANGRSSEPERRLDEAGLKRLAEILSPLEEPLNTLERRGIDLSLFSRKHATSAGLLPRFRVSTPAGEKWFFNKSELDAFLTAEQERTGTAMHVADGSLPEGAAKATEGAAADPGATFSVTDLHEVRAINDVIAKLQSEFRLGLLDLIPPPMVNAETVFPYEIQTEGSTPRLQTIREVIPRLRKLGERGLSWTRFKGLGEMNADELYYTSMDPSQRVLKKVTLEDANAAEEIFRVLMGDHVEPRREFIEKHALEVRDLDV